MFGGSKPASDGKGDYGAVNDEKKSNGPFGESAISLVTPFFIYFFPSYFLFIDFHFAIFGFIDGYLDVNDFYIIVCCILINDIMKSL